MNRNGMRLLRGYYILQSAVSILWCSLESSLVVLIPCYFFKRLLFQLRQKQILPITTISALVLTLLLHSERYPAVLRVCYVG